MLQKFSGNCSKEVVQSKMPVRLHQILMKTVAVMLPRLCFWHMMMLQLSLPGMTLESKTSPCPGKIVQSITLLSVKFSLSEQNIQTDTLRKQDPLKEARCRMTVRTLDFILNGTYSFDGLHLVPQTCILSYLAPVAKAYLQSQIFQVIQ